MNPLQVNPRLARLQTYPFDKLRALLAGVTPNPALRPVDLSIGEPKHPTPALLKDALAGALDGLSVYPRAAGLPELRAAMAGWAMRRYSLPALDPLTQVLPVNGTREALFSFAQAIIDPSGGKARLDRGLERRSACAREPAPVRREVRRSFAFD